MSDKEKQVLLAKYRLEQVEPYLGFAKSFIDSVQDYLEKNKF